MDITDFYNEIMAELTKARFSSCDPHLQFCYVRKAKNLITLLESKLSPSTEKPNLKTNVSLERLDNT